MVVKDTILFLGCNDEVWQNSANSYEKCVTNIKLQLEVYHSVMTSDLHLPKICMYVLIENVYIQILLVFKNFPLNIEFNAG